MVAAAAAFAVHSGFDFVWHLPAIVLTVTVRVLANGGKTFKQGTAMASAEVFACGTRVCGSATDSETIAIQR